MRTDTREELGLAQRLGPVSRYRYILYGVNALLLVGTVGVMAWQHRSQEAVTTRMEQYHLQTIAHAAAIREQIHVVHDALSTSAVERHSVEATGQDALLSTINRDINAALYLVRSELGRIVDIQDAFRGAEFEELVPRTEQQFVELTGMLSSDPELQSGTEAVSRKLQALVLSLEQLNRLHKSEHAELVEALPGKNRKQTQTFFLLVGGLLTVSYVVTRRVLLSNDTATRSLLESEQRLQDVLDGMFAFVGVYTTDGVLIQANRAPLEAASISAEDVLGKPFWETYWWSYSGEVQDQLRDALRRAAKGETVRYDVPIRVGESDEGEPQLVVIDVTFGPLYGSKGEVINIVGSAVDVTERVEAEVRLRRQADIIDQVHDSVISTDLDGLVTSWSKGSEGIFGYTKSEAIGRHISFIYPPERLDFLEHKIIRPLMEKGSHEVDGDEMIRKSGESFFVHLSLSMLRDSDGNPIGMIGYSMDITERVEAENALARSEAGLSEAQGIAHVGNWDWNIVTNELCWSDEIFRIFGLAPQEFGATYEAFMQTVHPEDRESVDRAVNDAVYEGSEYDLEHRIVLPNEDVRIVHERGEVTLDSDGAPIRMIGTVQDITERSEAEMALKQSERQIAESLAEKEVLLKEMHHRVKNNLQIVSSLLNLQSVRIEDEKVQNLFTESINRVSTMALIHEKLYRSGDLARVDFADYLGSLVDIASGAYSILGHPVKFELAKQEIYLNIDTAIPCALIVNELLSNSLKYAFPEDSVNNNGVQKICVEMNRDGEKGYVLIVSDNGCGFPEDVDFRNTDSLGLQIVNTLIEQLDGTLDLDSEDGVMFTLKFEESKQGVEV